MGFFDVAFTLCGEKGLPLLAAAVRSLWESCQNREKLRIHLLWWDIGEPALRHLTRTWDQFLSHYSLYSAGDHLPELASQSRYGYWYRLWLSDVMPNDIHRLLYLDCDIIAHTCISELWELELGEHLAAVVWDPAQRVERFRKPLVENGHRFGYPFDWDDPYFNSGVMLMNLREWRVQDIGETIHRAFFGKTEWSQFNDQDPLNLVLKDRNIALSPSWNLVETIPYYRFWDYELYQAFEHPSDYFEPKIRHFAGSQKPHTLWARWSHKEQFYGLLNRSGYQAETAAQSTKLTHRLVSQLVEVHYLVMRGLVQRSLDGTIQKLWRLVVPRPHLIPLYIGFLAYLKFVGEPR